MPVLHQATMTMSCTFAARGFRYEASFQWDGGLSFPATSHLTLNGRTIRAAGKCWPIAHGQPFSGAIMRCPYGPMESRTELYPIWSDNPFGRPEAMGVIQWKGEHVIVSGKTTDCH